MNKFIEIIKKNFLAFIILIVTIIYLISTNLQFSKNINNLTVSNELLSFSSNTVPYIYSSFNNTFLVSNLIETKLLDYKGDSKFSYSTMFANLDSSSKDDYTAIWNKKNTGNILVFNQKGFCYQISSTDKILDVYVNKNGFLVVLTKQVDGTGYTINVYNSDGELAVTKLSDVENLYPISVSITDDNRILAVSELDTNGLLPTSNITFSYINEKDNVEGETVFAGTPFENEIIANIEFSANHLIAYSKDKIRVILIANDTTKETANIVFTNDINFSEIIDDKYICVSLGAQNAQSTDKANSIIFYNFNGTKISTTNLDSNIDTMTPAKNSVIITSGRKVLRIDSKGHTILEYLHNRDFQNAYYIGKKIPLIIVENEKIVALSK